MLLIVRLDIIIYVVGLIVTLVAILIALVVAFKCFRKIVVCCFMRSMYELVLVWSFRCCVMKMSRQWMYDE